ncbi:Cytochrome P450 [Macleaya cordata]|uniref:Cytochrome P450 n=1 Tax=Macleaya cordata TaxID=56857 RepID=A0A200QND3_MACCD|nr:Cytochrome P450 [Macleaya cordata]
MGLPLIGETLELFIPSNSLDVPPFIKKRLARYGSLFRTSLAGRPVVVSADPEFNHLIFQKEGQLVEFWYMDSFAKLLGHQNTDNSTAAVGYVHKYLRNLVLDHFGLESLKEKVIMEMILEVTSKQLFGYDSARFSKNMSKKLTNFLQGLMSFPLNIPGTAFNRCLKNQKMAMKMMKDIVEERRASVPVEKYQGDFLDHLIGDMKNETFLTEEFIIYVMFGVLLASFETISCSLTLAIKLLTDHPSVLKELMDEHEKILRTRENMDSTITWKEYKSMTFTSHVINETLRLANVAPGILRRALKDIEINGYVIPTGWTIMVVPSALHMSPEKFEDPLTFNPWRWKDDGSTNIKSENLIAFGGGMRNCAGAEFSKVLIAIFLHVFVTKYRWMKIKGGDVVRGPALGFKNGFHIQVSEKT